MGINDQIALKKSHQHQFNTHFTIFFFLPINLYLINKKI